MAILILSSNVTSVLSKKGGKHVSRIGLFVKKAIRISTIHHVDLKEPNSSTTTDIPNVVPFTVRLREEECA